jgi:NADH-ubiquinone oxidoreductase chain 1
VCGPLFERFYLISVRFFLACTRLGVYTVIIAVWSSNSGYSLLGGLRALAQTISYEVRLSFLLHRHAEGSHLMTGVQDSNSLTQMSVHQSERSHCLLCPDT